MAVLAAARLAAPTNDGPILVMNAASMTLPVRAALDSFKAQTGVSYQQEPGASLEIARRFTDLKRSADVVLLADPDVFPKLLMPAYARWYVIFARNRIVLAYTPQSRNAAGIDGDNWRTRILGRGVEVGRADPNTDPSGYRTLLTMQLAERFYHETGLFNRLLAAAPEQNVRPREADQVALLQTHQVDYIWTYQNLAENATLPFVRLPHQIDLGEPADSAFYANATTRVLGTKPGDTLTVRGAPILFALTIPTNADHAAAAERFVQFLLSDRGRRILRAEHLDALDRVTFVGSPPASIR